MHIRIAQNKKRLPTASRKDSKVIVWRAGLERFRKETPFRIWAVAIFMLLSFSYFIYDIIVPTEIQESDFAGYDAMGDAEENYNHPVDIEEAVTVGFADAQEDFILQINKSIYEYKTRYKLVSLAHSDDNGSIQELHSEIAIAFEEKVVANLDAPEHVKKFYTVDYIKEALRIQWKYGIPASVVLANAADESSYGRSELSKYGRNYFGIKAKKGYAGQRCHINTPEEFTEQEYKSAKSSGLHMELKGTKLAKGRKIYVVMIKDYFRKYSSYRESFEDFAKFMTEHERYALIFQKGGNNWEAWCSMFRPKRDGGIPYATSTSKAKRLADIIRRYSLHYLDFQ